MASRELASEASLLHCCSKVNKCAGIGLTEDVAILPHSFL